MKGLVYIITNTVNGKYYIGQTVRNIRDRFIEHKHAKNNQPIYKAIQKYGASNFVIEILSEHSTQEELDRAESLWIAFLACREFGYNIDIGGMGLGCKKRPCSLKTRQLLSISRKKAATLFPKVWSKEERTNQSLMMLRLFQSRRDNGIITKRKFKGRKRVVPTQLSREKLSEVFSQMIWITDGIKNKRINKNLDLPKGWKRGRLPYRKGKLNEEKHSVQTSMVC